MLRTLSILLKRDLKATTTFPRLEILLFLSMAIFLALASVVLWPYTPHRLPQPFTFSQPIQDESIQLTRALANSFKGVMTNLLLFIFIPILMADSIAGEFERGTLLTLMTYPIKRFELLISKFVNLYFLSTIVFLIPASTGMLIASINNNVAPLSILPLTFLATILLLNLVLCSVSMLISVVSNRTLVAALVSVMFFISWSTVSALISSMSGYGSLNLYTPTGTMNVLIDWLIFEGKTSHAKLSANELTFPRVISVIAFQLIISGISLVSAYIIFLRKDLK